MVALLRRSYGGRRVVHPEHPEAQAVQLGRVGAVAAPDIQQSAALGLQRLMGRYSFTASVPAAGALRPLRDPDAPELDEDETGEE
jgi:hypothetical protein